MQKTNAMRMLDAANISYEVITYEVDESDLSGVHIAKVIKQNEEQLFKTLVLRGANKQLLVCCIPVAQELDLKKVAKAAHVKSVEMVHMKELQSLTGYIRGGCSPIGMKKTLPTLIDETAILFDEIYVSAGMRGAMFKISSEKLIDYCHALVVELCKT
ncbi:MAG: Cys-tRNA(Pro) deacylase [Erysipelotrichia bacterium]|nr:Cys-tRNA(Pro) deacylase [Erysipelotrichia bacterium]NCC55465.1 Cys-tRNA(Pro) deacylase [Erysipelotrichia bacterium]